MSVQIAVACDERYLPGAIGTLAAIRMALGPDVEMTADILHDGLTEKHQDRCERALARLRGKTRLRFVRIDSAFQDFPDFYFPSKMPYARLLLPRLVEGERVLYVDSDILFLKSPLPLFQKTSLPTGIGVVLESSMPRLSFDAPAVDPGFPVDLDSPYFNSGFLLLDLPALRGSGLMETALEILSKRPASCRLHDQSALNYAANGRFELLGQEWNTQTHRACFDPVSAIDALSNRSINPHFVTEAKPWLTWCPYPADEMFRILLDAVDPEWRTPAFNAREQSIRRKYRHAGALARFFHARAALKKTFGVDAASDTRTAEFWEQCSSDTRRIRQRAEEMESLLYGWRKEIQSKLA